MTRQIVTLNGSNWQLGQAPPDADPYHAAWAELDQIHEWLPATVPGNVQADLLRTGRIPDPAFGRQTSWPQWPTTTAGGWSAIWTLRSPLKTASSPTSCCTAPTTSRIFPRRPASGSPRRHVLPQVYDITGLLSPGSRLAVRITGSRGCPRTAAAAGKRSSTTSRRWPSGR